MKRFLFGLRVTSGVCIFALLLSGATTMCQADTFPAPAIAADKLDANVAAQLQTQAQIYADDMFDYAQLKIDELNRVCKLTPEQQVKFKIAAKGAVDRALAKWMDASVQTTQQHLPAAPKQQPAQAGFINQPQVLGGGAGGFVMGGAGGFGAGGGFGGAAPAVAVARDVDFVWNDAEAFVDGELQFQVAVVNNFGGARVQQFTFSQPLDKTAVERENVWVAAEKNILTPEQSQAWTDAVAARAKLPQATPADQVLAQIDRVLLLDPSQREKFFASVRPLVNARVRVPANGRVQNVASIALTVLKSRSADVMAETVGEAQLNYWKARIRQTNAAANPVRFNLQQAEGFAPALPADALFQQLER
ncbi:MAG: hypothetical protein WD669_02420 [Pirellulales bacterium]